jgi:hypothetical protein
MTTYLILTGIVIIVLIIHYLIKEKFLGKGKSTMEKLEENETFQGMKTLFEALKEMNKDGTDQDTMPEGFGEFGHDVTNPIPVNTVFGSTSYLGRLRTLDGTKVEYERTGSTRAKNIESIIDKYEIFEEGEKIATLYICPYNKKISERAPEGFRLAIHSFAP